MGRGFESLGGHKDAQRILIFYYSLATESKISLNSMLPFRFSFYRLLAFAFIFMTLPLRAEVEKGQPSRVPAYPHVIEKVQPNGDTLHIRLVGDERKHWVVTEDGYKIAQNKRGWYCYLRKDRLTCRKAHDAANRSKREMRWLKNNK